MARTKKVNSVADLRFKENLLILTFNMLLFIFTNKYIKNYQILKQDKLLQLTLFSVTQYHCSLVLFLYACSLIRFTAFVLLLCCLFFILFIKIQLLEFYCSDRQMYCLSILFCYCVLCINYKFP